MNGPESLHTHTTLSDGENTHKEMFEAGARLGLSVMAFTDHDSLPNDKHLNYLESVRGSKLKWIVGTEITAGLPREMGTGNEGSFHIVGLFVDPKNPALAAHCEKSQAERVRWVHATVARLKELGFDIEAEQCLALAGEGSVGKPHVVAALMKETANQELLEEFRKKMAKDAESNSAIKERYDHMMHYGPGGYPYSLVLGRDAYIPVSSRYEYLLNMDDAVSLIHNAGGIASLAHYFTVRKKIPLPSLKNLLETGRLDALETVYRVKPYKGTELSAIKDERETIKKLSNETGALTTGGPDAHNTDDIQSFLDAKDLADETAGMTERIIASGKVNTKWSSF